MTLPQKTINLPGCPELDILRRIAVFLEQKGIHGYVVGGFLRDLLLRRPILDIDLALAGDTFEVGQTLSAYMGGHNFVLDKKTGLVRITLTRLQIDLGPLHGDIGQDLARRDFTIDALAADMVAFGSAAPGQQMAIIDPCDGMGDIQRHVLRMVDPHAFAADPLRLLRAVRLETELGFSIEERTLSQIKTDAHLLVRVAGERQREELLRLLNSGDNSVWHLLDELGLLTVIFPELEPARGVEQPREHTWDVLDHSINSIAALDFLLRRGQWRYAPVEVLEAVPWSPELAAHFQTELSPGSSHRILTKLACLLHDVAKPQTRRLDDTGRMRFFGHPEEGAAIAVTIMGRLRFSKKESELVDIMVRYHLRPTQLSQDDELPSARAIYRFFRDTGEAGVDTLFLSLADHLAARGPHLDRANWDFHAGMVAYVLRQRAGQARNTETDRLITGDDLIDLFDLEPGPLFGDILDEVEEARAAGEVDSRQDALDYARRLLDTRISRDG